MESLRFQLTDGWYELLKDYITSDEFTEVGKELNKKRNAFNSYVYPKKEDTFKCFKLCPLDKLKVVILGEEPYSHNDCSNGLAYGYNGEGPLPQTMSNIHREFENNIWDGLDLLFEYSLEQWAKHGILLLNTSLTVSSNQPKSHKKLWESFMDNLFNKLLENKQNIVYVCLGKSSKKWIPIISKHKSNLIIEASSPDPIEANKGGWFKSEVFIKINKCLTKIAKKLDVEPEEYIIKWK